MDKFTYTFDFGSKPAFIIDAWFKRAIGPVLLISIIFFPLCTLTSHWVTRLMLPSIATGAIIIFVGTYVYRRQLSIRRIKNMANTCFHYEIDETGIRYDNDMASGVLKWGFNAKLIPLKRFILLQSNEIGLIPLPIDTPPEVLAFIETQLRLDKAPKHDGQDTRAS